MLKSSEVQKKNTCQKKRSYVFKIFKLKLTTKNAHTYIYIFHIDGEKFKQTKKINTKESGARELKKQTSGIII